MTWSIGKLAKLGDTNEGKELKRSLGLHAWLWLMHAHTTPDLIIHISCLLASIPGHKASYQGNKYLPSKTRKHVSWILCWPVDASCTPSCCPSNTGRNKQYKKKKKTQHKVASQVKGPMYGRVTNWLWFLCTLPQDWRSCRFHMQSMFLCTHNIRSFSAACQLLPGSMG